MKNMRNLLAAFLRSWITLIVAAGAASAGPVEDVAAMAPGTWYEVLNSHLESVKPNPLPAGNISGVFAWGGGAYDTKRGRMLIWGGGHDNYAGNEVYAFNLGTLTWEKIWGPSTNIPVAQTEAYPDGAPASRHTYDNLVYNSDQDVLFASGGSLYNRGSLSSGAWEFDLSASGSALPWSRRAAASQTMWSQSSYDPVNKLIYRFSKPEGDPEEMNVYDPVRNEWRGMAYSGGQLGWELTGEIDPVRRVMVIMGGREFHVYNLETGAFSSPRPTGDAGIINAYAPGLTWDSNSQRQKLVAWDGDASVYVLDISADLSSYSFHKDTLSSGNRVTPPTAHETGTYSRFQYSPDKDVFVLVNDYDQNVLIYKPSTGGGSPIPPPARPRRLRVR
jgi:hypothetical protein